MSFETLELSSIFRASASTMRPLPDLSSVVVFFTMASTSLRLSLEVSRSCAMRQLMSFSLATSTCDSSNFCCHVSISPSKPFPSSFSFSCCSWNSLMSSQTRNTDSLEKYASCSIFFSLASFSAIWSTQVLDFCLSSVISKRASPSLLLSSSTTVSSFATCRTLILSLSFTSNSSDSKSSAFSAISECCFLVFERSSAMCS
mmetsp:Transcript_31923/g.76032  ORF Transcript_31923/g.76032 Transcript_31923/m.76032 type:complete len:201 (+) Transcript_31923:218-820(+)